MKLFYSYPSPFVRKVLVTAHEVGVFEQIAIEPVVVSPIKRDATLAASNPLSKIPTLVLNDGRGLFDSPVICEYLNALGAGSLLPSAGHDRFRVLRDQALSDGMMDAAILARHETVSRPAEYRWEGAITGQHVRVTAALDVMQHDAGAYGARVDLGVIAIACALGYLDIRVAEIGWREGRTALANWYSEFAQRPSMLATAEPMVRRTIVGGDCAD